MGKRIIGKFYTDVSTPVTVAASAAIPFNSAITNSNCVTILNNTTVQLRAAGVYDVQFNATAEATAVGNVEMQLAADGVLRGGAHALSSATAVGDAVNLSFNDVITIDGCCRGTLLNVLNTDATSLLVSNLIITKIV